jgi:hypothetical protein
MVAVAVDRNTRTLLRAFVVSGAVAAALLAPAPAHAAGPGGSGPAGKSPAVTLESVAGSTIPRVILTAKAAERLGIATGTVAEEQVVRKQIVSGLITPSSGKPIQQPKPAGGFAGFGRSAPAPAPQPAAMPTGAPADGEVWVRVALSQAEWDRLAKDKPARLLALSTREKLAKEVLAKPSGMAPLEDTKRSMLSLYYMVPGKDHGLTLNQRMRVELQLEGSSAKQKVVPYGAVLYDAKGAAWVYVNPKPLTFERQRIQVERVVGDLAVLSEGPPVGTSVVSVGAALLYGAEIFKK